MRTRQLGNTDLHFTRIGLGTWAMGGGDWAFSWGPQDDQASIQAIHRALDLGVNWLDTAPVYGLGHCEEVVGQALRGLRQRPLIATKCERCWNQQRQIHPFLLNQRQPFLTIASHTHTLHLWQLAEMAGHRQLIRLVVFDEKQVQAHACTSGSCTTTLAPPPGQLLARMLPPWASAISRQR